MLLGGSKQIKRINEHQMKLNIILVKKIKELLTPGEYDKFMSETKEQLDKK